MEITSRIQTAYLLKVGSVELYDCRNTRSTAYAQQQQHH